MDCDLKIEKTEDYRGLYYKYYIRLLMHKHAKRLVNPVRFNNF